MVESSAVLISGLDGLDGWDLCVGLLYEHRFAVLKSGSGMATRAPSELKTTSEM